MVIYRDRQLLSLEDRYDCLRAHVVENFNYFRVASDPCRLRVRLGSAAGGTAGDNVDEVGRLQLGGFW